MCNTCYGGLHLCLLRGLNPMQNTTYYQTQTLALWCIVIATILLRPCSANITESHHMSVQQQRLQRSSRLCLSCHHHWPGTAADPVCFITMVWIAGGVVQTLTTSNRSPAGCVRACSSRRVCISNSNGNSRTAKEAVSHCCYITHITFKPFLKGGGLL
jgi:hypothetical protein